MRLDGFGNNLWLDSRHGDPICQAGKFFLRYTGVDKSSAVRSNSSVAVASGEDKAGQQASKMVQQQWAANPEAQICTGTKRRRRRRRLMWSKCVAGFATSTGVAGTSLAGTRGVPDPSWDNDRPSSSTTWGEPSRAHSHAAFTKVAHLPTNPHG